jgi:hypothetical protein
MAMKVIIEYFGFRGEGSTVKEAKLEAGRKITALHIGHWLPELIECRWYAVDLRRAG